MTEPTLAPATEADAHELAATMRANDAQEVLAQGYASPLEAVLHSLKESDLTFTLRLGGEVAAVGGVVRTSAFSGQGLEPVGAVWLLTSDVVGRRRKGFLKASRTVVGRLLEIYPVLINCIDARYDAALRWARWLGFRVGEPEMLPGNTHPFCPIILRRTSWAH